MAQLTIPDEITSQAYTVESPQTAFNFSFAVFSKADLRFMVGTAELPQTAFTLSGSVLDGGGYQGGTVTLNTPVSATTCLLWRETTTARTSNFSPSPTVPVRDIDVALNRLTAMAQDNRRDIVTGGGSGSGVSGVSSVNSRVGAVNLSATDVGAMPIGGGTFTGPAMAVTPVAGDSTTKIPTTAWVKGEIASLGGGVTLATTGTPADAGTAARGTGTHAARDDHVHNVPVIPYANITGKPSTFAPSAHSHTTSDITSFGAGVGAALAAGAGVSLSTSSGTTTITATGPALSTPHGYYGAYENNIRPTNSAATNAANLNSLIATLNSAGGGTIWFNDVGVYSINSTINLKSNVAIRMSKGAFFSWTGSTSGTCFQTSTTDVMYNAHYQIIINEGAAFNGVCFDLHSMFYCSFELIGQGGFYPTANTGLFCRIMANSTAGETFGISQNRNVAYCRFNIQQVGVCGSLLYVGGVASGFGGAPQVVTLCTFESTLGAIVYNRGIQLENWCDTNTFSGNTYCGIYGSGGVGLYVNAATPTVESGVYNILFTHLAIDTFGSGLGRYGVVLQASKWMRIEALLQGPPAENGPLTVSNCISYQVKHHNDATNNIAIHEKGITRGL